MQICLATTLIYASILYAASAFVPYHCGAPFFRNDVVPVSLEMTKKNKNSPKMKQAANKKPTPPETPANKKLTSTDIINRARAAAGMPEMEEAPKIFEDDLLEDMRQSLLVLEKRVKEGAGALGVEEVEDFEARMKRVVDEMNEKLGISPPPSAVRAPAQTEVEVATTSGYGITDLSNDETPAYDGTGGMGMARGTRSTYVIPGMDEMSPEEYRKALQASVSNRQTRRKGSRGGVVGNRAALQYLDQLGAGGSATNWKTVEEEEEDDV